MGEVTRTFPDEVKPRVEEILSSYPSAKDALFPLIHLAQETWGHVDGEAVELLASIVGKSPAEVYGVVSFYTMFHRREPGKIHLRVCTNISCMLHGADELLALLEEKLGVRRGERTPDGRFSIEEAECLGACDRAPVVMVNDDYEGPVDAELLKEILSRGES